MHRFYASTMPFSIKDLNVPQALVSMEEGVSEIRTNSPLKPKISYISQGTITFDLNMD